MPESPFGPEMPDETAPLPPSPSLGGERRDAALAALLSLATFAPVGKVMGAATTPLKRAGLGAGLGVGAGALADVASSEPAAKKSSSYPTPMHELQVRLRELGLYPKGAPIDGVSVPGGPTERAVARLKEMFGEGEPLHVLRMIQDPAYKATEEGRAAEGKKADAERAKAELGKAETERKNKLDKQISDAAREGESWGGFAKRWGSYIGGAGAGAALGLVPGLRQRSAAGKAAQEAEAFAGKAFAGSNKGAEVTSKNVADKAASVNTFWERGRAPAPFAKITTSGELSPKSMGYKVADQTPAGDLYKLTKGDKLKAASFDALALGAAGADYLGASHLQDKNKKQADEARERFRITQSAQDAVEASHAQGRSNAWGMLTNAALPFASSYLLTRKAVPLKTVQPSMKAQADADGQRLKVQDYLNRQPAGGPQSVLAHKGGAPAPIHGGALKALPAPTSSGGVGPHTTQIAHASKAERGANFDKVFSGALSQRSQQLVQEHVNAFGKAVREGPNAGRPLLTTRKINELQRKLEVEHGMPISNHRLRKLLKDAGVVLG